MFDISNELSTSQDGLVFLLVRFLLESTLPPVNERINLKLGSNLRFGRFSCSGLRLYTLVWEVNF